MKSIFTLSCFLSAAFLLATNGAATNSNPLINLPSDADLKDVINPGWMTSCGVGVGRNVSVSLSSCNSRNCTLKAQTTYSGKMTVVLGAGHSNLTLTAVGIQGAKSVAIGVSTYRGNFTRNSTKTTDFNIQFPKGNNGTFTVQLNLSGNNGTGVATVTETCQAFTVFVSSAHQLLTSTLLLAAFQLIIFGSR